MSTNRPPTVVCLFGEKSFFLKKILCPLQTPYLKQIFSQHWRDFVGGAVWRPNVIFLGK